MKIPQGPIYHGGINVQSANICKQELVCCAETLSKLLKQGCKLPDPAERNVTDPKLLAWLHEPQLLQRDEKEIEGYTLQVPAQLSTPSSGLLPVTA